MAGGSAATGGVGLIVREPGVGKSRLLAAARRARRVGAFWGRCPPYGEGITYGPLADGSTPSVRNRPSAAGRDRLEPLRFAIGGCDRPATTAEIAEAARALVAGLARDPPVLLVAEDMHDAERSMLDLMGSLAARA